MADVSLEQYAAVRAAVADAFPLEEALAVEAIPEASWKEAHRSWAERLVADAQAFESYAVELQRAEDRLRREVLPLETDPRAWAAFLAAYGARPAGDMTAATGLGLPDVSRLTRHWQGRCWSDVTLVDQLARHRRELEALPDVRAAVPEIRLGTRSLRSSKENPPAPPAAETVPQGTSLHGPMPIDEYATLVAELSTSPGDEERILARRGLSRSALSAIEAEWASCFERDALARADFRRLLAHQRNRVARDASSPDPAPAPPPSRRARKRLGSTDAAMTVRSPVSSTTSPSVAPSPAQTATKRPGTAEVQAVTGAPTLPFRKGPPPLPASPRRFVPQSPGARGKTADVKMGTQARPATLPFDAPKTRRRESDPRKVRSHDSGTKDVTTSDPNATLPFRATPGEPVRDTATGFTIEHYASLCTELGLWPNLAPEILARYGLKPATKAALDLEFKAKMATDRALYERWYAASEKYLAWLLTSTPAGTIPK